MKFLIIVTIGLWMAGCASNGFDRGALKSQIGVQNPVTTDDEIKAAMDKKSNLPNPFKLAVYFKKPQQSGKAIPDWRWSEADRDALFKAAKDLENEKVISKVFPIIDSLVAEEDIKSLRLAAAKHGADALLVVSGVSEVDRYINGWGWTYALILPTLFVPGSQADGLFIASATLWDVRNEFLYLSAESEGAYSQTHSAAFGDSNRDIFGKSKTKAVIDLQKQLKAMIKGTSLSL